MFDVVLRSIDRFCRGLAIAFLALSFSWGWTMPAGAQSSFPEPSTPAIDPAAQTAHRIDANEISSEKLSQFVQAYLKVVELLDRREGELQAAETEFESARLQQEIETDALALIEAAGLTLQEYLQLLGLANIDAEFGERVVAQLQENF